MAPPSPAHQTTRSLTYEIHYERIIMSGSPEGQGANLETPRFLLEAFVCPSISVATDLTRELLTPHQKAPL